ncbi:hypothetical protein [Sphingomonas sanguinis]|uniref:Uncharacterized protein n=1 Tax=Sphingomonas sanguinis TaxID=33051 RepID=A0A147HYX4_9SPHN|nr:hypothetical protein [Sphingomonas sanguinis]KTT70152.1 hypothetical protein NS319_08370 [Sphingomonas sanguinis]
MASLPIDPTFARQAPYTPKPNIRVVFLPGPAQTAMAGELAKLPAETQEATLEELEIAALARDVIALAKTRLSTAIYPAFLRWADAAILCMTGTGEIGDASSYFPECDRRYLAACNARDAVHRIPAVTAEDYTFKTYLIELMNRQDAFSPLEGEGSFTWSSDPAALAEKVDAFVVRLYELSNGDPVLNVRISNAARQPFLDAIAGIPVQAPAGLPLRNLLVERNAITEKLRTDDSLSDEVADAACDDLNRLDNLVLSSAATTADDVVIRLIMLAQLSAEGHAVDDAAFAQAVIEARDHFGIGMVPNPPSQPKSSIPVALPQGYDPFMRGPFLQWQRAYEAYAAAKVERTLYEKGEFALASAQYEASVQDADAEIAFEAKQSRFDELADAEYQALQTLIRCVAPAPTELATKLKLFHDNRMWLDNAPADLLAVIAADARRFGGHGAYVQSDKLLLDTFAAMQREMRLWFDQGPGTQEEDAAADARASALEDVLFAQRANTVEGVIAKLRETFRHLDGSAWSDHATLDPDHTEFQRGVKNTDFFTRALWHSIEDLARIGGVSLTEVRA